MSSKLTPPPMSKVELSITYGVNESVCSEGLYATHVAITEEDRVVTKYVISPFSRYDTYDEIRSIINGYHCGREIPLYVYTVTNEPVEVLDVVGKPEICYMTKDDEGNPVILDEEDRQDKYATFVYAKNIVANSFVSHEPYKLGE